MPGHGRVFLAQQGELANRRVALKIATDVFGEAQALAQLEHANIVPIYSTHRSGPFQAVCMPYLGPVVGEYTDWSPLHQRERLFPEDLDKTDPWQFKNVRVVW